MKKQIILTALIVTIAVVGCFIHGKKVMSTTWGEMDPDVLIDSNKSMTVQVEELENDVFDDESISEFSDLYDNSAVIIMAKVDGERKMCLQSTDTIISVEKIYKDETTKLSKGESIILVEPFSIHLESTYHSTGYQMLKKNGEYILFLNPLKCVDGYKFNKREQMSFMPSTTCFSRYCISEKEKNNLLVGDGEELYSDYRDNALLTNDVSVMEQYEILADGIKNYIEME